MAWRLCWSWTGTWPPGWRNSPTRGAPRVWDLPTEVAIKLMAFAQTMNLDIEPGLAFHELAHRQGDLVAQDELGCFRDADRGAARKWIDVAMRRSATVDLGDAGPVELHELSKPLMRWNRNYIAMLKVAQLVLAGGNPLSSLMSLLDWMIDDFILAGPAVMYAARHFGPRIASAKMLKDIRAADDPRPEPQVGDVDVARRPSERPFRRIAGIGRHRAADDVGPAHLVNACDVVAPAHAGQQRGQVVEALGDDVNDVALALDLAAHAHHRRAEHDAPVLLEQVGPDDEIGDVGLVLQRDEHHPLRRSGLLTKQHQAGDVDPSAVARVPQLRAGDHLSLIHISEPTRPY